MRLFIVPFAAVVIDQITKVIVRQTMPVGRAIPIAGDTVRITHVENPGMAFGIELGNYTVFTIVSLVVVGLIALYFYRSRNSNGRTRFAFSIILGGAVGNLFDRVFFGTVTDFMDVNIPDIIIGSNKILGLTTPSFTLYRWPVFNFADACVTVGMIILFWLILFTKEKIV